MSVPQAEIQLTRMLGRPFGRDEEGRRIDHGTGRTVAGAVRYLQSVVGDRALREAPPGVDIAEREALVEAARTEAVERLVAMLNAAIDDERYHVTADYLLNESNNYSYEFRLFVAEYCRTVSGDPDFFYNQGRRSIPGAIIQLARPMGIRQTYAILPRFTAKYVRTDLRVLGTTPTSATLRWYAASQLAEIPEPHRQAYVAYACRVYQGTFAAIPTAIGGLPPAEIEQTRCQLLGDECCEWTFRWERPVRPTNPAVYATGIGGSAAMLAYLVARLPGWELVATVAATLLPAGLVFYGWRARRVAADLREQRTLLLEQREVSEREFDRSEQANTELQAANLDLQERIAALVTINELAVGLATTLDMSELLDRSLSAVVTHLRFDRALILLIDEDRNVLTAGRAAGATPEMTALVEGLEMPVDHEHSQLAALARATGPVLFTDVDQDSYEPNRQFAQALGVTSFLGTPLVTKGRTVGILAVDNRLTMREVEAGDGPLLYTLGNLIASAVENARLYREIEEHARVLEDRVASRTEQLARATVEAQDARAAAEAASEAKSQFLANVSHELRTPLTSVVGFTKIIRRRLDEIVFPRVVADGDPKVERAMRQVADNLAIMVAEGERLTSMINDVLDLAKIESGKFEWAREPLDIGDIVARAAAATSSLFESRDLRLETTVEEGLPPVLGDRDRLIQVVINLVSNAVKFTREGGVACRVVRDGDDIVVSVTDTGIGIAPDDRDRVFEQFRQAGDTLTDKPRGTGLGLPISRQIVEHHGGRMWLESEVGVGSTFSFSLPVAVGLDQLGPALTLSGERSSEASSGDPSDIAEARAP